MNEEHVLHTPYMVICPYMVRCPSMVSCHVVDGGPTWWLHIHGDCLCVCFCDTGVLSVVHHTRMPQVEEEALVVGN